MALPGSVWGSNVDRDAGRVARLQVEISQAPELTTVRHIAHVQSARRIIQDGRIKAGLVYDDSKLNKSRISVAWVSANTWALGSIYGTVEFKFSWTDLIADQNIYWVEAMTNYKPSAFRLLLSKRNITNGVVRRYNPQRDDGPLRFKDGEYYWNGNYTSEFMIEDDLSLDRCTGIRFVAHHSQYCSALGSGCEDLKTQPGLVFHSCWRPSCP
jgi:hypothetical protein